MTWLEPLGVAVKPKRRPNDAVPMRMVNRITGPADRLTDHGIYSIHDFASTYTAAEDNARETMRRICAMGPPFSPQKPILLDSGVTVFVDRIVIDEAPHWEFYADTIERFVATYRVDLRFVAA